MRAVEIGHRIREVRHKLGLTQAEFGKLLGVTNISVARYEAGRIPHLQILGHIGSIGGVTVGWILQGGDAEDSRQLRGENTTVLDMPQSVQKLIAFLRKESGKLAGLPREKRKRYEERLDESVSRIIRELEEYRRLLQGRSQPASTDTKRRLRKQRWTS
jgi:transcriptional regulator with XRE-family HTH domain